MSNDTGRVQSKNEISYEDLVEGDFMFQLPEGATEDDRKAFEETIKNAEDNKQNLVLDPTVKVIDRRVGREPEKPKNEITVGESTGENNDSGSQNEQTGESSPEDRAANSQNHEVVTQQNTGEASQPVQSQGQEQVQNAPVQQQVPAPQQGYAQPQNPVPQQGYSQPQGQPQVQPQGQPQGQPMGYQQPGPQTHQVPTAYYVQNQGYEQGQQAYQYNPFEGQPRVPGQSYQPQPMQPVQQQAPPQQSQQEQGVQRQQESQQPVQQNPNSQ